MSYKISITGIVDPKKVQELIEAVSKLTRLQPKTIANSLKKMPYDLPIFHDETQMKEAYTQLQNCGAALELEELKKSRLEKSAVELNKDHIEINEAPKKTPRVPYAYRVKASKKTSQISKPYLYLGLFLALLILTYSIFTPPSVQKVTRHSGKKIGVKASELPQAKAKISHVNKSYDVQRSPEVEAEVPEAENMDVRVPSAVPAPSPKTNRLSITSHSSPSSVTGQGIPSDIDPKSDLGRSQIAQLRQHRANNLKDKAMNKSMKEKISLLKQSLNLDIYNDDTWNQLKSSLREDGQVKELKKVQLMQQKMVQNVQRTLEEISRSIGGAKTQVRQSLAEVEFTFAKNYENQEDFNRDAAEVFKEFRTKYPDRKIILKDNSGQLEIRVPVGEDSPFIK